VPPLMSGGGSRKYSKISQGNSPKEAELKLQDHEEKKKKNHIFDMLPGLELIQKSYFQKRDKTTPSIVKILSATINISQTVTRIFHNSFIINVFRY
jgi:hypothetical protein